MTKQIDLTEFLVDSKRNYIDVVQTFDVSVEEAQKLIMSVNTLEICSLCGFWTLPKDMEGTRCAVCGRK
jgi:hypothetical protein